MTTTVIVPTFNEGGNVEELVSRLERALLGHDAEVLFVDDSTDDTPEVIRSVAATSVLLPVRLLHRRGDDRVGGLAGAVTAGIALAGDRIVVMDGDLQHPPELVPDLLDRLEVADVAVASRYVGEGDASGLSSFWRRLVSNTSTVLAQACFPRRVGRRCSDPMTGFFAFHRRAVELERLRPRGFKILLEILARHDVEVAELPFTFGVRTAGESKASWRNGVAFLYQLASLRMGRMSRFAAVGAFGTVVNLVLMWLLVALDVHYLAAAVVAAEVSILHNFLMQERFVYRDLVPGSNASWGRRCAMFLGINNVEALCRLPVLAGLVTLLALHPVLAQAITLAVAFVLRFLVVSHVIYNAHHVVPVRVARVLKGEMS